MEPVTHFMTGAVLARSGLNRRAAYATVTMVLAAETPDLDTLWSVWGPVAGFQHHRGWTHTFLGLPFEAALLVGVVWAWHRWRPEVRTSGGAPVRWGLLYGFAIVALLSHIFLDWTNNYGVRPFFPFDPRWYAGSFVFIFDPVLFVVLLGALVAPALFGLVSSEVGARGERFRGRGWARAGLMGAVCLWAVRGYEAERAREVARAGDYGSATVRRLTVDPFPADPFQWQTVVETADFYQVGRVDSWNGTMTSGGKADIFYRGALTPGIRAAEASSLGRAYMDWSKYPVVREADATGTEGATTVVSFRDLRFMYDVTLMSGREDPPLMGLVFLDARGRVVEMEMDGRRQR